MCRQSPCLGVAFVLVLRVAAGDEHARAFNYPEHAWITERGIAVLLEADPGARQILATIRRVINSDRLCKGDDLMRLGEPGCFSLADLPALSADHSSTPPALLARWFCAHGRGQLADMRAGLESIKNPLLANVGAAIANADPGNDLP
jgi:hypothetical protein